MKTLGEMVAELGNAKTAYKFSVSSDGRVALSVDGLMGSLMNMNVVG
ncbi:hypothetical protein HZC09_04305 [Candidatus Micrarchaeota archaeon]|nr:hypothetical protein [Candidatus Micrarchaeota archaeon]